MTETMEDFIAFQKDDLHARFESAIATLHNLSTTALIKDKARLQAKLEAVQFAWNQQQARLMHATTVEDVLTIREFVLMEAKHLNKDEAGTELAVSYIMHHAYMLNQAAA